MRALRQNLKDIVPGSLRLPPSPPVRRGPWLRFGVEKDQALRVVFHLHISRPLADRDRLLLELAMHVLWEQLNRIVREVRGACYDLDADTDFGHDLNAVAIHAVVSKAAGPMLIEEIFHQLDRLRNTTDWQNDLEKVRSEYLRNINLLEDDLHELTDYYIHQTLKHPLTPPLRPRAAARLVSQLTADDVAKAARTLLTHDGLGLVLLSSFSAREKTAWRRRFSRLVEQWL